MCHEDERDQHFFIVPYISLPLYIIANVASVSGSQNAREFSPRD